MSQPLGVNTYLCGVNTKHESTSDAWSQCSKVLRDHDIPMVAGWKEVIDTLLVFVSAA